MQRKVVGSSVTGVSALGFKDNVKAALELFVSRHTQFRLVSADEADLLIVHGDQGRDPEVLKQYYAHKYSKPGIVISSRSLDWPDFICLPKPYDSEELVAALDRLAHGANLPAAEEAGISEIPQAGFNASRMQAFEHYQARVKSQKQAIDSLVQGGRLSGIKARIAQQTDAATSFSAQATGADSQTVADSEPAKASEGSRSRPEAGPDQARHEQRRKVVKNDDPDEFNISVDEEVSSKARVSAATTASRNKPEPELISDTVARPLLQIPQSTAEEAVSIQILDEDAAEKESLIPGSLQGNNAGGVKEVVSGSQARANKTAVSPKAAPARPAKVVKPARKAQARPETLIAASCRAARAVKDPEQLAERQAMISRLCGYLPDLDLSRPDVRKRAFVGRDNTLLACLLNARKVEKGSLPQLVTGLPLVIGYLPENDTFIYDIDEDMLLQLATSRFSYEELGLQDRAELAVPDYDGGRIAGLAVESATAFLWKISLLTARGRLFSDMDPEKLYQLKLITGSDQIFVTPHADKIEKLWYGHRLSVLDVAKILKIPQRFAFSFMVGAFTLGWFQE